MLTWSISSRTFHLKYTWKISRNASDAKTNLFVEVSGDGYRGMGEAAPNVRYGEIPENLVADFERIRDELPRGEMPLEAVVALLDGMKLRHALRFAIESAYVHWLCARGNKKVYEFLGLGKPAVPAPTAFSLPIMPVNELRPFIEANDIARFKYIKIKVNREEAAHTVSYLSQIMDQGFIVDANESFTDPDEVIHFLEQVDTSRLVLLEQPMPASMGDAYPYLNKRTTVPLFADESVTDNTDIRRLKAGFDGINVKLMKAGGYVRGIQQLKAARAAGMKTMTGCMVETTLGIWSALNLSSLADYVDLDGFLILQGEPFELIQEKDGFLRMD
jgi:L-alanine-DL-glutamate epimerase-like enolase superfamily enzyme